MSEEMRRAAADNSSDEAVLHDPLVSASSVADPFGAASTEYRTVRQAGDALKSGSPMAPKSTFGRFTIERELGQGAMGAVFLALDTRLKRHVALKFPKLSESDDAGLLERFYREARSAATLRHPNICPVYDADSIDGVHYIAMAYIEGRTLSEFIRPLSPPSPRNAALTIRKIALAVEEAHRHGIVHRDLKPANIMIDDRNEPIVMDFGLARAYRQPLPDDEPAKLRNSDDFGLGRTQIGAVVGTPRYMSPEQAQGLVDEVGPASDIFSLGVIFYELLTGNRPFQGASVPALLANIVGQAPAPFTTLHAKIDPRLESICLTMLAKSPSNRYASMQQVADAISEAIQAAQEQPHRGSQRSEGERVLEPSSRVANPSPRRTFRRTSPRWFVLAALLCGCAGAMAWTAAKFSNWFVSKKAANSPSDALPAIPRPERAKEQPLAAVPVVAEGAKTPLSAADRFIAEWVLEIGGAVEIQIAGETTPIRTRDSLPAEPFSLTHINLRKIPRLDAEHLARFDELSKLSNLNLGFTNLDDSLFALFSNLPSLTHLDVGWTRLTPAGLAHLRHFRNLKMLSVDGCRFPVSVAEDIDLKDYQRLEQLWMQDTQVAEWTVVKHIAPLTDLTTLALSKASLGDNGVKALSNMTKLDTLLLSETSITDESLATLRSFKALKRLFLSKTQVTPIAAQDLREALPNCRIDHSFLDRGLSEIAVTPHGVQGAASQDRPPGPHVLAGFDVTVGNVSLPNNFKPGTIDQYEVLTSIKPLYWNQEGALIESENVYGDENGPKTRLINSGDRYAVGAIRVRSGTVIDSIEVTFMLQRGDRLDPLDAATKFAGGNGGNSQPVLGNRLRPARGVVVYHDVTAVRGLGLIYADAAAPGPDAVSIAVAANASNGKVFDETTSCSQCRASKGAFLLPTEISRSSLTVADFSFQGFANGFNRQPYSKPD